MAQELTKQDLAAPEEHPVMREVVEDVHDYVEDYKERERTLLQKLFPDRQRRHIELAKHKTVKARYEFQMQAIQIAHEAQLQGIQEMYNDFLIKGKAKIRKERAEFFQEQFEDLMTNLTNKSQEFSGRINASYKQLEKMDTEFLRERQEQLIHNIVDGYYDTAEKLIRNFQNILNEEIHNTGASRSSQGIED
jgi:paraquat-inducible protein B